jgi:methanogenic corrinoid protein MtbC1
LAAAQQIIEDAEKLGVREIDILLGIIAPMLYQIGEDWKRGTVTITEEHRFTAFCKEVLELISAQVKFVLSTNPTREERAELLLMNAPGNCHTLALSMLALWLANQGKRAWIIDVPLNLDELVALVRTTQPRLVLISMVMAEQAPSVVAIAERIAQPPHPVRPKIIVGGYAVKTGLVLAIPGAEVVADISSLLGG